MRRKLQVDSRNVAMDIANGNVRRTHTLMYGAPGGGKTRATTEFFDALHHTNFVNGILWAVPRDSLREQVADEFRTVMRELGRGLYLNVVSRSDPPFRTMSDKNCAGIVTTYQALNAVWGRVPSIQFYVDELKSWGTGGHLMVYDEGHHLADPTTIPGGRGQTRPWADSAKIVGDMARHRLITTGTLEREDNAQIPYVKYAERDGRLWPEVHIRYSFSDALREHAVIPFQFHVHSGWAEFQRAQDEEMIRLVSSGDMSQEDARRMIRAFLDYESYWAVLLDKGVAHWSAERMRTGYKSRLLVICDTQERAHLTEKKLIDLYGYAEETKVAVSELGVLGSARIRRFRKRTDEHGEILVTCAMAHEGFDAPDVSHVIYLSDIRSTPWMIQALFRGNRMDYRSPLSWAQQVCHAFVMDDPLTRAVISKIEADQLDGLAINDDERIGPGNGVWHPPSLVTHNAALTGQNNREVVARATIPTTLPRPSTLTTEPKNPKADKTTMAEIKGLAKRRDTVVGRGRTSKDLELWFGKNWSESLSGSDLTRVRDFLKTTLGVVS